jgi:MFS family permease
MVIGINERFTAIFGIPNLVGPWVLAAIVMGIGMVLNQALLRPDPLKLGRQLASMEDKKENDSVLTPRSMGQIFRQPNVLLAVTVMALSQLGMVVVMVVTPVYLDQEGYGTISISTAVTLHTLGMFAFASITGWLISNLGRMPVVWLGALIMAGAGLAGYYASSLNSLYFSIFLLGLGWNLCYISGSTLLSDELISQERGRAQGINELVIGMAAAIGSLASGSIYGTYGYSGVNIVVLIVVGIIAVSMPVARWAEARTVCAEPELGVAPPGSN